MHAAGHGGGRDVVRLIGLMELPAGAAEVEPRGGGVGNGGNGGDAEHSKNDCGPAHA